MKYRIEATSNFKKNYKLIVKRGYNIKKLEKVIDMLAEETPLPATYHDHPLKGKYEGYRDCHIEPNWLLVYKKFEDLLVLVLTATGTHDDLFKE